MPLWDAAIERTTLDSAVALELGARDGGLSLYLARKGFHVTCSDLNGPTERAYRTHRAHGVADRIEYRTIDASAIPFPDNSLECVAFKSVLGGVGTRGNPGGPREAVSEIWRVLKPGGLLLFAENAEGSPLHAFFRRFQPWSHYWTYPSTRQMREFCVNFRHLDCRTAGFLSAFGRSESQRTALRRVDRVLEPFVPASMRYCMYGFARK